MFVTLDSAQRGPWGRARGDDFVESFILPISVSLGLLADGEVLPAGLGRLLDKESCAMELGANKFGAAWILG